MILPSVCSGLSLRPRCKQVICEAAKPQDSANPREDASHQDRSLIENCADAKLNREADRFKAIVNLVYPSLHDKVRSRMTLTVTRLAAIKSPEVSRSSLAARRPDGRRRCVEDQAPAAGLRERDDIRYGIVLMHVSDQHIAVREIDNARRRMDRRPHGALGVACLLMSDDHVSWSSRER